MRSETFERYVDALGRVVLPKLLCRDLGIEPYTLVKIQQTEKGILLQPAEHKESPGD